MTTTAVEWIEIRRNVYATPDSPDRRACVSYSKTYDAWVIDVRVGRAFTYGQQDTLAEAKALAAEWLAG